MSRVLVPVLLLTLTLGACTLPPEAPTPPVASQEIPAPQLAPASAPQTVLGGVPERLACEVTAPLVASEPDDSSAKKLDRLLKTQQAAKREPRHTGKVLDDVQLTALSAPRAPALARPRALSPQALIREAQRAALVEPTPRCYFGNRNICRQPWQVNQTYKVYVTPTQTTKLLDRKSVG